MAVRKTLDIDLASVDPDGLADGNSSAGATVTLDGALTSGGTFTAADGLARQISITDLGADDQSGATYTVTGTDANNDSITDAITGPTASATVESAKYFKTITSIAIASPVAGSTVDIGTVDEIATQAIPLNYSRGAEASIAAKVTGTVNFTLQETFSNIHANTPDSVATWFSVMANKTADCRSKMTLHATGARVIVNSHSAGAEIEVTIVQDRS